jgi:hypothetical protein
MEVVMGAARKLDQEILVKVNKSKQSDSKKSPLKSLLKAVGLIAVVGVGYWSYLVYENMCLMRNSLRASPYYEQMKSSIKSSGEMTLKDRFDFAD